MVAVCVAAALASGSAWADEIDDLAAAINARVAEWANRRLSQPVLETYKNAQTITSEFPSDYKEAVRQVLEWKVGRLILAMPAGLQQDVPLDAPPEDVRRWWRLEILKDVGTGSSTPFRQAAASALGPALTAVALGYRDADGGSDRLVRVNAAHLLVQLPGSGKPKVDALLRLLRTRGTDQGVLFVAAQEVGRQKIAAAVPHLVGLLHSRNVVLQSAAARALGSIGDEAALDPLLEVLNRTGDTVAETPDEAREAVLAVIQGVRGVMMANSFPDEGRTEGRVVAALMRRVLADPDRTVIVEAADAVRQIAKATERLNARMPEEEFQRGIERLREWWLRQMTAKEQYQQFFRLEPFGESP